MNTAITSHRGLELEGRTTRWAVGSGVSEVFTRERRDRELALVASSTNSNLQMWQR